MMERLSCQEDITSQSNDSDMFFGLSSQNQPQYHLKIHQINETSTHKQQ
jgi:hypothetical protein